MEELTRSMLLKILSTLSLEEVETAHSSAVLADVIIDPWEKRIVFSDSMEEFLGSITNEIILLDAFYQYIPETERKSAINKYESSISELLTGRVDKCVIRHSVTRDFISSHDIELHLQVISVDKTRYIVGFVSDVSSDMETKSFNQLFGEGMNSYLFTYDMLTDTCYVSDRFVEEFDLDSNTISAFKSVYRKFLHPDDVNKLAEAFSQFLDTHLVDPDTEIRFLAPGRGDLILRVEGFSDAGRDGKFGGEGRYISGILSDVTNYIQDEHLNSNLIDGAAAIIFNIDINANRLYFSENIHEIIPDAPLEINGDYVEIIAQHIVKEDRNRFRSSINKVITQTGAKFQSEIRVQLSDDRFVWIACRGKSVEDRITHTKLIVGLAFDLTQMNEIKEHVDRKNAIHDLTRLPTREKLSVDTEALIRNRKILSVALVLVDINDFHAFNDRYGWKAGDTILAELSLLLKRNLPEKSKLYHIGTDTFAVLWPDATQMRVNAFMEDLQEYSRNPFNTDAGEFYVSLGISASFYPTGNSFNELITNAEIALHKVKQDKKLKHAIYSPVDLHDLKERVDFEFQITQNLRNNMENFQLYYQPLIDAQNGNLLGAEALLRWQTPDGELVNPEKVVAALESTDQMEAVGNWILNEAIKQVAKWRSKGAPEDFYVHINATSDDLIRKDYVDEVQAALERYNVSPENILIELTETSLTKNMAICRKNIRRLSELNIRTALDDFGSGYSSFNYLKELPVNEIKIDKTFVDDMDTVEFNRTFISAMTMLAHSIGKGVVVEGIETELQANIIREMGADVFQGYLFDKPLSVFAFWNKYFA